MHADDKFVREHEAFVRGIAQRTRLQLDLEVDLDDLVAFGFRGLLEARARYDAARGVQFKSFAYYRVRGAILDGVRSMAYLPRRAYARLKAAEALDATTETEGERRAQTPALRSDAEATVRALDQVLGRAAAAYCMALASEDEPTQRDDPESQLIAADGCSAARLALDQLPERERALVHGVYFEQRTLDELAKVLGMSKSWASRLHGKALDRMRALLDEGGEDG